MVRDVCSPPKSVFVGYAMRPIAPKINPYQAQHIGPPRVGYLPWHQVVKKQNHPESGHLDQAAYDYVNAIIANRSIPANVRDVLSSAPSHARAFIQEFIIKQITMALEGGYHHPPCISVFTGCF